VSGRARADRPVRRKLDGAFFIGLAFASIAFGPALNGEEAPSPSQDLPPPVYGVLVGGPPDEPRWLSVELPLALELLPVLADYRHLWTGSTDCPLARRSFEELEAPNCQAPVRRLEVRVVAPVAPGADALRAVILAAPVSAWQELPEDLLPAWQVGPEGLAVLPQPEDEPLRLRLVGAGLGSDWIDVGEAEVRVVLNAVRAPDTAVQVLDETGRAVESAYLRVATTAGRKGGFRGFVRTDERGTLVLEALPETTRIRAVFTSPAGLPVTWEGAVRRLPPRISLPGGCILEGSVVAPDGLPLVGVVSHVEGLAEGRDLISYVRSSNSVGRFQFPVLPRTTVAVALQAQERERRVVQVDLSECRDRWTLDPVVLGPAHALSVRVTDEEGQPVAEAAVSTADGIEVATDGQGIATIDEVGARTIMSLTIRARGFLYREAILEPPIPASVEFALERAATVTGTLVDSRERPVREGTYELRRGERLRSGQLGQSGEFEIDVYPGEAQRLLLRSPQTLPVELTLEPLAPGGSQDLGTIVAPEGLLVRGRVVSASGAGPVPGARVWALRTAGAAAVVAWARGDYAATSSSEDGRFELEGLPARPGSLRVQAAGHAPREIGFVPEGDAPDHDLGDVIVEPGGTVEVFGDAAWRGVARADWRGEWHEPDMVTAPFLDGHAAIENVPAGPARVTVLERGEVVCEAVADVPNGGSVEVDCERARLRVEGLVRVGGRPVGPGRLVWLSSQGGDSMIVNHRTRLGLVRQEVLGAGRPQVDVEVATSGRFSSDNLAGGTWLVLWNLEAAGPTQQKEIRLPDTGSVSIELDFPARLVVGWVRDDGGQPVGGARVVEMTEGSTARASADGSFEVAAPASGRIAVRAFEGQRASKVLHLDMESPAAAEPVELIIEREPSAILIRVRAQGFPAAGALVFVESESGVLRILSASRNGEVEVPAGALDPGAIRASALWQGGWGVGQWSRLDEPPGEVLEVHIGSAGALLVRTATMDGELSIEGSGWAVSRLMRHAGIGLGVSPGQPLLISGLPTGDYAIFLGGQRFQVLVGDGGTTELDLP
jgi:hypothetical protein